MTRKQFFRRLVAPIVGAGTIATAAYARGTRDKRRIYWRITAPMEQDWWCISHSMFPRNQPMHNEWFREGLEKQLRIRRNEWGIRGPCLDDPEGARLGTPPPLMSAEEMTTDSQGHVVHDIKIVTIDESGHMAVKHTDSNSYIRRRREAALLHTSKS